MGAVTFLASPPLLVGHWLSPLALHHSASAQGPRPWLSLPPPSSFSHAEAPPMHPTSYSCAYDVYDVYDASLPYESRSVPEEEKKGYFVFRPLQCQKFSLKYFRRRLKIHKICKVKNPQKFCAIRYYGIDCKHPITSTRSGFSLVSSMLFFLAVT